MRETLPIFLSPAILNKTCMIQVKKEAEDKLQLCIIRDLNFDGDRCYDFAHTFFAEAC
jgi:hypothetical protein